MFYYKKLYYIFFMCLPWKLLHAIWIYNYVCNNQFRNSCVGNSNSNNSCSYNNYKINIFLP